MKKKKVLRGWFYLQENFFLTENISVFYVKPSSEKMICNVVSSELYLILFFKMKRKKKKKESF